MISIICPVFNESNYIANCIDSIINNDFPHSDYEIIIVDGGSNDNSLEIIESYRKNYSFIKVFENSRKIVPISLNIAIRESKGEYIMRIDAHCVYPKNYIQLLLDASLKYNVENVGCVINTLPSSNSLVSKAIAIGMSHPMGVGNSYFRIGATKEKFVDTVPFGFFKRTIFDEIGLFSEDLIRNQDDEFNARIINSGGSILLLPYLSIDYFARKSIYGLMKMFFQYGFFKPIVNMMVKKPTTLRQFAPLILVLFLVLGVFFSIYDSFFIKPFVFTFLFYLAIITLTSISLYLTNKIALKLSLFLPIIFLIIHFSYGFGYLIGITVVR